MSSTKIEFAVQMTCESCAKTVQKALKNVPGIEDFDVNLKTGSVTVQTTRSADDILKVLHATGKKAVVRGLGGVAAAVAILDTGSESIKGVVRFVQEPNCCIVDGTVDGLQVGKHQLTVHETGDLSKGCESVGECFNPVNYRSKRMYGDLGTISAENDGRSAFRFDNSVLTLSDVIGRALVISDTESGKRLSCGIIARSAGLFQNPKTICACDGVTIWNEKVDPKPSL